MSRRAIAAPPTLPGYSYVRPLGSGGFADVYLFDQDLPRRIVAAKVLAGDLVTPDVIRTFNAEADILARLSVHPSVVTIHDASISADGRPYFIMEYCPDTMGARYRKGPLPLTEVLDAGVRIGGALETVHRAGLLHRDVKPSNVLITSLGMPVLAALDEVRTRASPQYPGLLLGIDEATPARGASTRGAKTTCSCSVTPTVASRRSCAASPMRSPACTRRPRRSSSSSTIDVPFSVTSPRSISART